MAQPKTDQAIGEQLRAQRAALELSLAEAATKAKLKPEVARQLEQESFQTLEHDIYTLEALKRYARLLELNPQRLERAYLARRGPLESNRRYLHSTQLKRSFVTSRWMVMLGVVFGVLLVLGYLFLQLRILAAPPRLEVMRPAPNEVVTAQTIQVQGVTDAGAEVFVNTEPVVVGENGEFARAVSLREGLNTITVEARSRSERSTRLELDVIYTPAPAEVAEE